MSQPIRYVIQFFGEIKQLKITEKQNVINTLNGVFQWMERCIYNSGSGEGLRLDDPVSNCITDQVGDTVKMKLFHNLFTMSCDCLRA